MSEHMLRCSRIAIGDVVVWKVALDPSGVAREPWIATLAEHEVAHARRLGESGAPWAQAHTALRGILGHHLDLDPAAVALRLASGGKPELAVASALRFSMSRTDGLALIAVSCEREVGVDLERVNDDLDVTAVAAAFLPPGEIAAIEMAPSGERRRAFFAAWTRYEARLKLRGTGLGATDPTTPTPLILVRAIPLGEHYAAAVAAEGGNWHVELREWTGTV